MLDLTFPKNSKQILPVARVAAAAAEYRLFNTALLQNRPIILKSLLIVATSQQILNNINRLFSFRW